MKPFDGHFKHALRFSRKIDTIVLILSTFVFYFLDSFLGRDCFQTSILFGLCLIYF